MQADASFMRVLSLCVKYMYEKKIMVLYSSVNVKLLKKKLFSFILKDKIFDFGGFRKKV